MVARRTRSSGTAEVAIVADLDDGPRRQDPAMTAHLIGWEIPRTDRTESNDMTNEEFVRRAYAIAEVKDIPGILPPTGNRMDAPCCDVFKLENGRIQVFDCYPSGTVILGQLGVLGDLDAVLQQRAAA
jgi:hypothetical protein